MRRIVLCSLMVIVCTTVVTAQVKISQVYGGGANQGAPITRDYVELYNTSAVPVTMTNWSVQYAASTGTFAVAATLNGTIPGNGYWLVGLANGSTSTTALNAPGIPAVDTSGSTDMSATTGKVALRSSSAAITATSGQPTTATVLDLVDFVGYGTATTNWNEPATTGAANSTANNAPAPSATLAIYRNNCGATDTDNNKNDWNQGAPSPRNSVSAANLGLSMIGAAFPFVARQGDSVSLRCTPRLCATNVLNPGTGVSIDLTAFGLGVLPMHDDGLSGDDLAGDGLYMLSVVIPGAQAAGSYQFPVFASDGSGNSGGAYIGLGVILSTGVPANDNCDNAQPIAGPYFPVAATASGTLSGANIESNPFFTISPPVTAGHAARRGVWYTVTGTGTRMTASLCGTLPAFDSVLIVACGSCDGLTIVEDDDNFCNCQTTGQLSKASWCSILGTTYYVWVGHQTSGAQTNAFTLSISDDGVACKGATACPTCTLLAPVAQTEAEAGFGPATNDGCDVQATTTYPGSFTDIPAPGSSPVTLRGTARNMGGNRDVDWYRFQATTTGQITASVTGQGEGFQVVLFSLTGVTGTCPATATAASAISTGCGTATLSGTVTSGTWYALRVICVGRQGPLELGPSNLTTNFGGFLPAASTYNYAVVAEIAGAPLNDLCANAAWIPPGGTTTAGVAGDNSLAALDGAATACGTAVDKDVWFLFRPNAIEVPIWTIKTCNAATTFDTVIEVYDGCGGNLIACNDDSVGCGGGTRSRLDLPLMPGMPVWIRLAAKGSPAAGGVYNLVVAPGNDIANENTASYQIPPIGGSVTAHLGTCSSEGNATACGAAKDMFFYFTPGDPCATAWTFTTCCNTAPSSSLNVDTVVSVCSAAPTPTLSNSLACLDDGCTSSGNSTLGTVTVTPTVLATGVPYLIRVQSFSLTANSPYGGPFTLTVLPVSGGANNLCANATTLTLPATASGTTACGVTNDGTATCDASGAAGLDVWYKFTLSATTNVHLDTCGSAVDTTLAVYTGACGTLTEIACNDDATGCPCGAPSASIDLSSLPAATYTVRVSTKAVGGAFALSVKAITLANDDCCGATPVACGSATPGTTVGATAEVGLPVGCVGPQAPGLGQSYTYTNSVWYTVTAPPTGGTMYADTLASAYDSKIFVWTGACGALTCVTANDDIVGSPFQSKVAWKANPNQQYWLMVGPFSSTTGAFTLTTGCTATPANDDCATPTPLAPVTGGSIAGTTIGATCTEVYTSTGSYPSCAATAPAIGGIFDVWYSYTACANTSVTFTTCGAYNTMLSVHTACPTLTGVNNQVAGACNDEGPAGCLPGSSLTVAVTSGTTYRIRVAGAQGAQNQGTFTLTWAAAGPLFYQDSDGDGFGNPASSVVACLQPGGYVTNNLDCNDANPAINPSAQEVCDGVDNDCDSLTDDADPSVTGGSTFYQDADGDGYGNPAMTQIKCVQPVGYVTNSLDCDDSNSAVHPGATEICNGIDDDCDLLTDDADPGITGQPTWYQDSDGDGYGNPAVTQVACAQPVGYVANNGDCNDNNTAVNPGATEICNNIDDDCDSIIDEVCPTNDHCTTATVIGDGTTLGDNTIAGSEIADVTCGLVNHDIWYSYTNPNSCTWTVTASMCPADGGGASFDAVIHVFSPPCGALGLIACNNDTCGTNPKVTFTLAGGATALIAVSGVAPGPGGLFGMVLSHTSATMSQIGPGCSDGGGPGPTLTLSGLPVLCAPRVLSITGAAPRSAGMLMFSFPGTTTILSGSCPLYLNNGSLTMLFFIGTDMSGNWGAGVTVPCDPSLECATFHVQGFLFPNNPPPFYQVTSGLSVTLGL